MTKFFTNNTIQLLCKLINVNNLLYTYANVMQQIDNSSCLCDAFTIAYAIDIAFLLNFKKIQYVLIELQTHLRNAINNMHIIPSQKWHIYPFFLKQFIITNKVKQRRAQVNQHMYIASAQWWRKCDETPNSTRLNFRFLSLGKQI
jgi:hypothetical protein